MINIDVNVSYISHENNLLNPMVMNVKQREFLDRLLGLVMETLIEPNSNAIIFAKRLSL